MRRHSLLILAAALLACGAERPAKTASEWRALSVAVPAGYRPAIHATGIRPRVVEYKGRDYFHADVIASFDTEPPRGMIAVGNWLVEIPALAVRNDLGTVEPGDGIVEYIRGISSDEGSIRIAYDPKFKEKLLAERRVDVALLTEVFSLAEPIETDDPLQMLVRKTAEAALLDGKDQGRLAMLDGTMKDRIHVTFLEKTGRPLILYARDNPKAREAAEVLLESASKVRSLGFIPAE